MAWIKSFQSLATHRKTLHACRLLGIKNYELIGRLHLLWWWAVDNAPEGALVNLESADIALIMGWEDDPRKLVDALVEANFLELNNDVLHIHDWEDYAGGLITRRKADADRKRKARQVTDIHKMSDGSPQDVGGMSLHQSRVDKRADADKSRPSPGSPLNNLTTTIYDENLKTFAVWENTRALAITPFEAEELKDLVDEYGDQKVVEAIEGAARQDRAKVTIAYITVTLNNWKLEGKPHGGFSEARRQPRVSSDPPKRYATHEEEVAAFNAKRAAQRARDSPRP